MRTSQLLAGAQHLGDGDIQRDAVDGWRGVGGRPGAEHQRRQPQHQQEQRQDDRALQGRRPARLRTARLKERMKSIPLLLSGAVLLCLPPRMQHHKQHRPHEFKGFPHQYANKYTQTRACTPPPPHNAPGTLLRRAPPSAPASCPSACGAARPPQRGLRGCPPA